MWPREMVKAGVHHSVVLLLLLLAHTDGIHQGQALRGHTGFGGTLFGYLFVAFAS